MLRADRLLAWMRMEESERRFAKRIREAFETDGKKPVLLKGSWGRRPNLRNQAPTPGIGLARRLVAKYHIDVYVVCESWTSTYCPSCDAVVNEHGTHRVLHCSNIGCDKYWDRDVLGALNILRNGVHLMRHGATHPVFRAA